MKSAMTMTAIAAALFCACGGSTPDSSATSSSKPPAGGAPVGTLLGGTADACAMLTPAEIAEVVGNPVQAGKPAAGPEVCDWDAEPNQTDALIMVRLKGSIREQVLCPELQREAASGKGLAGIGDAATWQFSNTLGFFNSSELAVCDAKGYVHVALNGKADEAKLKEASLALARKVMSRR
jgi:hypothetical protein